MGEPTERDRGFDADHLTEIPDRRHTELPETRLSRSVDGIVTWIGRTVSWLWLALIAVIVLNVVMRFGLGEGRIELEELQWHLYAIGFLCALSFAVVTDDHIRVDIFHERMSMRTRAWVEVYGTLFLLLPFLALILIYSIPFVAQSFASAEVSQAPGGLPLRWAIKGALPVAFVLLITAAISRLSRATALLFGYPQPLSKAPTGGSGEPA